MKSFPQIANEIIVTEEQLLTWINKQPDDRKIDMSHCKYRDECGCIMVQYGKDHFGEFNDVGAYSWWAMNPTTECIATFDGFSINSFLRYAKFERFTNYGILKKFLHLKKEQQ